MWYHSVCDKPYPKDENVCEHDLGTDCNGSRLPGTVDRHCFAGIETPIDAKTNICNISNVNVIHSDFR